MMTDLVGEAMCGVRLEKVRSASEDDSGEMNLLYDRLGIAMCIICGTPPINAVSRTIR